MNSEEIVIAEAAYNQIQHIEQTKTVPLDEHITARILTGEIDPSAAERAVHDLISRHESLRTCFKEINGEIKQIVHASSKNFFVRASIRGTDRDELLAAIHDLYKKEAVEISQVGELPLAKFVLVFFEEQRIFILDVLINHIISDAWSAKLIKNEFDIIYDAILSKGAHNLARNAVQLKEYCASQNSMIALHKDKVVTYWKEKVGGFKPRSDVAAFYRGYELRTGNIAKISQPILYDMETFLQVLNGEGATTYRVIFEEDLFSKIKAAASKVPCFISMFMYACLGTLLYFYTQESDVLIASPIADRSDSNKANIIGNLMGGIYIPINLSGQMTINDIISAVSSNFFAGTDYIIFDHDVLGLNLPQLRSRTDIYINYVSNPSIKIDVNAIEQKKHISDKNPYYALSCVVQEYSNTMLISWKYNNFLLPPEIIEDLAQCLETLIATVTEQDNSALNFLSDKILK